jgi:hypothetical protein
MAVGHHLDLAGIKAWHGKFEEWKLLEEQNFPYPKINGSIGLIRMLWNRRKKPIRQ